MPADRRISDPAFIAGWIGSGLAAGILTVGAVSLFGSENWIVLLLVALVEGAVLGGLQLAILRRRHPVPGWFTATLAGIVLARCVQYVLESGPWMEAAYRWPHGAQLAAGAAAGLLAGAAAAACQIVPLRRRVQRAGWWLAVRGLATALTFVFLGAVQFGLGYPDVPFVVLLAMLLGIGGAAGAIETAVEAPFMLALLEHERPVTGRRASAGATRARFWGTPSWP